MVLSLLLHWFHLLGVVIWVGGITFSLFALRAGLPLLGVRDRARFLHRVMGRFLHVVWGSIVVVTATGLYRVFFVSRMTQIEAFLTPPYGHALTTKIVVVLGMIAIAGILTFSVHKRMSVHVHLHEAESESPKTCVECGSILGGARRLMALGLILASVAILLAAFLRGA